MPIAHMPFTRKCFHPPRVRPSMVIVADVVVRRRRCCIVDIMSMVFQLSYRIGCRVLNVECNKNVVSLKVD